MTTLTVVGTGEQRMSEPMSEREIRLEFGRRLQAAMDDKGWNQSDLARAASKFMPDKKSFRRDNVSNYVRGTQKPGPLRMRALCRALGKSESDLMPVPTAATRDNPPLALEALANGNTLLRVNQIVSMETAMKIIALIEKDHGKQ